MRKQMMCRTAPLQSSGNYRVSPPAEQGPVTCTVLHLVRNPMFDKPSRDAKAGDVRQGFIMGLSDLLTAVNKSKLPCLGEPYFILHPAASLMSCRDLRRLPQPAAPAAFVLLCSAIDACRCTHCRRFGSSEDIAYTQTVIQAFMNALVFTISLRVLLLQAMRRQSCCTRCSGSSTRTALARRASSTGWAARPPAPPSAGRRALPCRPMHRSDALLLVTCIRPANRSIDPLMRQISNGCAARPGPP